MAFDLFDLLEKQAFSANADRIALETDTETVTFRELHRRVCEVGAGLGRLGLGEGSRVGIMMGNRLEHVEAFFALAAIGATVVPVNILLRAEEVTHICDSSEVEALIVDEQADRAGAALTGRTVITAGTPTGDADTIPFADLRSTADGFARCAPSRERALVHFYTSGTTGRPKGAVHTHGTVLDNSLNQTLDIGITGDDTYLLIPSLTWSAGFNSVTLALLNLGGRVVIMDTGSTTIGSIADRLESSEATIAVIAPTLLRQLARDPATGERIGRTDLRLVLSGSEPLSAETIGTIGGMAPRVQICQAYGLSEFPTIACTLQPGDAASHAGSAGRATTGVRLAVRDRAGTVTPTGEGELLIRSNAVMQGYLNDPEATARTFHDGWLTTGDLVRIDDAGYVWVVGRLKELIISGGMNVYPAEIEAVIDQIPGVDEVAVIGVTDEKWGEVPAVIFTGDAEPDAVSQACRASLATFKQPRHFHRSESPLPRTASGKLRKLSLQDLFTRDSQDAVS